ncbi:hypothetical protein EIP86_004591, partial [Pleurotus ostreatoroseus]
MHPHRPTSNPFTSSSARGSQEVSPAASYAYFGLECLVRAVPTAWFLAGTWSGALRAGVQIYREGGAFALFQGHSATLLRIFPYAAIRFMAYDQLERTTSVVFTYPLELVRVRMAFYTRSTAHGHSKPSFMSTASEIFHETAKSPPSSSITPLFSRISALKFYRGFSVSVVGMIPYAGTSFLIWGALRAHFTHSQPRTSSSSAHMPSSKYRPIIDLGVGAVAGAISQTVSYPFEVIRRRMQVGGLTHPERWLRWSETVRAIWNVSGWRGFYVGLGIGRWEAHLIVVLPRLRVNILCTRPRQHIVMITIFVAQRLHCLAHDRRSSSHSSYARKGAYTVVMWLMHAARTERALLSPLPNVPTKHLVTHFESENKICKGQKGVLEDRKHEKQADTYQNIEYDLCLFCFFSGDNPMISPAFLLRDSAALLAEFDVDVRPAGVCALWAVEGSVWGAGVVVQGADVAAVVAVVEEVV